MTLSRKVNRPSALRISALRETTRTMARPLIEVRSVAIRNEVETRRLVEETGDWLLLAGVSLLGWLTAATAIGFV